MVPASFLLRANMARNQRSAPRLVFSFGDRSAFACAVENGFAKAMWCGERACEDEIKEKFNASSRNMPFDQEKEWFGDTCVCCGKKAKKVMYFAKAY